MKTVLSILTTILLGSLSAIAATPGGSYADTAPESPVDGGKWDPNWSKAFQGVFNGTWGGPNGQANFHTGVDKDKNKRALQSILDAAGATPEFCGEGLKTPAGAQLFALAFAKAMCVPESGCNQNAENPDAPNGSALGLFQIGVQDAKNHKCMTAEGRTVSSEKDLKDGAVNSACMAQIMINCATGLKGADKGHIGKIAEGKNGGKGFVGCFWEPIRKGTRKARAGTNEKSDINRDSTRGKIAKFTKEYCEAASRGPAAVEKAGIMTREEVQTALNQLVPGDLQNQPGIYDSTVAV